MNGMSQVALITGGGGGIGGAVAQRMARAGVAVLLRITAMGDFEPTRRANPTSIPLFSGFSGFPVGKMVKRVSTTKARRTRSLKSRLSEPLVLL